MARGRFVQRRSMSSLCTLLALPLLSAFVQMPHCKRVSIVGFRLNAVEDMEDIGRPPTFLDEDDDLDILFVDETKDSSDDTQKEKGAGRRRWEALNPKIKERLVEKGQARAIANKKKREPAREKKRRMMMQFKKLQQDKKRASKIERPLGFDERAPLSAYLPGMQFTGIVISLTNYGAYVDVGTECDGLLHVSQITRDFFVEHPRQVLTPGDEVLVTVRNASPELKKLQLTMLDSADKEEDENEGRIPLADIEIDDELWGELKRVTDFGAYVEVGAEVDGFLHFMDHPSWDPGSHPSEFMQKGQRVRIWVSDLDRMQRRIKLTGNRPSHLPGPRLEF